MPRRSFYIVGFLLLGSGAVGAQTPTPQLVNHQLTVLKIPAGLAARLDAEEVVSRVMTFDANHDGKVTRRELAERMHDLLDRGDADKDGELDRTEIGTMARSNRTLAVRAQFAHSNVYGFGDEEGFSSRLHIEGIVDDLHLDAARQDKANKLTRAYLDELEEQHFAPLTAALRPLLTDDQLTAIRAALSEESGTRTFHIATGTGEGTGAAAQVLRTALVTRVVTLRRNTQTVRTLASFGLSAEQLQQAQTLIERHPAMPRISDADRTQLLERLSGLLDGEEQADLQAALGRRPVVSMAGMLTKSASVPIPATMLDVTAHTTTFTTTTR